MKNKVLKGILLTMFLASLYVAPHVGESEVENKATVEALSTTNKVIYTTKLLTSSSIEIASCESIKPTLEVIDNLIVMSPLESDLQNENQNNNENIEETVVEEETEDTEEEAEDAFKEEKGHSYVTILLSIAACLLLMAASAYVGYLYGIEEGKHQEKTDRKSVV